MDEIRAAAREGLKVLGGVQGFEEIRQPLKAIVETITHHADTPESARKLVAETIATISALMGTNIINDPIGDVLQRRRIASGHSTLEPDIRLIADTLTDAAQKMSVPTALRA